MSWPEDRGNACVYMQDYWRVMSKGVWSVSSAMKTSFAETALLSTHTFWIADVSCALDTAHNYDTRKSSCAAKIMSSLLAIFNYSAIHVHNKEAQMKKTGLDN
eukprot:1214347-Amphidinium_carterae.1